MPDNKSFQHFPQSVYDRPAIAAANMLSGNLDATTRAIFSPMTLSPDEMKNVRQKFMADGMENDPIIKTAVDLATNPIVIIGLIMALGPWGKIANPAQMAKLFARGGKFLKGVNPLMRSLSSPLTGWRGLQGFVLKYPTTTHPESVGGLPVFGRLAGKELGNPMDALMKIVNRIRRFGSQGYHAIERSEKIFQQAANRPITAAEQALVQLKLEGMHHTPVFKEVAGKITNIPLRAPVQGRWIKLFGKDNPIMPDLTAIMQKEGGKPLMDHFSRLQAQYKRYGKIIFNDRTGQLHSAVAGKGVDILDDYGARVMRPLTGVKRFFQSTKEHTQAQFHGMMKHLSERGIIRSHAKARTYNSIPAVDEIDDLRATIQKSQGVDIFGPGMYDKYKSIIPKQIDNVADQFRMMVKAVQRRGGGLDYSIDASTGAISGPDAAKVKETLSMVKEYLTEGFVSETGPAGMAQGAAEITRQIAKAAKMAPEMMEQHIRGMAMSVGAPGEFMLNSSKVFKHYVDTMSTSYGWWKNSTGQILTKFLDSDKALGGPVGKEELNWIRRQWADNMAPLVMGIKTPGEFARANFFADIAGKFEKQILSNAGPMKLLSQKQKTYLLEAFSGGRGALSDATLGGKISGLLYTGALGANLSPVSKNLMQNWITTFNLVGPKNMVLGLKRITPDLLKLPGMAKKVGWDRAIRKAFPEFYREFGGESITKAMAAGDISKEGMQGIISGGFGKFKQAIMTPFAASEKFNRLLAFYSTHEAALASGVPAGSAPGLASNLAAKMTMLTQFTGGTVGMPAWSRGVWAPFRQFGHFPSRMAEMLYASMRMAPEGGLTLGPLGRTMAGSAGIYTIMKNIMKMDVSQGLVVHALPGPVYEQSSFYPAPYIPPLVGAMGDVLKAFHTGDFGHLGGTAALFVPGGLGARRAWKTYHPKYARYDERTPEGRIPIYNDKHALISTQSPMQLAVRGLGLKPVGPVAERQMMQYLLTQRDKIRAYRRDYLESLAANNLEKARSINKAFRKKYPSLGSLKTKRSDIRAVKNRKEVTRLHRTIKGFPSDYQPLFRAMLEHASMSKLAADIDANPDSLEYFLE